MLWSALPEDLPGRPGAGTARFSKMDSGEACFLDLTCVRADLDRFKAKPSSLPHFSDASSVVCRLNRFPFSLQSRWNFYHLRQFLTRPKTSKPLGKGGAARKL